MPPPEAPPSSAPAPRSFQRLDRCAAYPYAKRDYFRRFAWLLVQAVLVRPSLPRAYRWRRFWLRRFGATIHPTAGVRPSCHILHPWLLTLGAYSILGDRVRVYNLGPITIGEHTVISQDVDLCAGGHDYTQAELPLLKPPIIIGSGVWICAGAFIGPGVTVGDNCVVAARAVVCKDIAPGLVVAGNPAVFKKRRVMREG